MALTPIQRSRRRVKALQKQIATIRRQRDPLNNLMDNLPTYEPIPDDELQAQTDKQLTNTIRPVQEQIGRTRAHNEHIFKVQADAAQSWGGAMMQAFTGGQPGQAGMDYSKANFGGSYLPAIGAQFTTQLLGQITHDFNESDWKAADELAGLMDKVPGLRQDIENDIITRHQNDFKSALDSFQSRVQLAGLMLDKQAKDDSIALAREQMGIKAKGDAADRVIKDRDYYQDIADKRTTSTGTLWIVQRRKDGSFYAKNTGKKTVAGKREDRIAGENAWKRDNLTPYQKREIKIAEAREKRLQASANDPKAGGKLAPRDTAYLDAGQQVKDLDEDIVGEPLEAKASGGRFGSKKKKGKYEARDGVKGVFPDGSTDNPRLAKRAGAMGYQDAVDYAYGEIYPGLKAYGYTDKEIRQLAELQVSRIYSAHGMRTGKKKKKPKKGKP